MSDTVHKARCGIFKGMGALCDCKDQPAESLGTCEYRHHKGSLHKKNHFCENFQPTTRADSAQPVYAVNVTFGIGEYVGEWTGKEVRTRMEPETTIVCKSPSKEYAELVYKRLTGAKATAGTDSVGAGEPRHGMVIDKALDDEVQRRAKVGAQPETEERAPDPKFRNCACVCHKVGLLGFLCCPCSTKMIHEFAESGGRVLCDNCGKFSELGERPASFSQPLAELLEERREYGQAIVEIGKLLVQPTPVNDFVAKTAEIIAGLRARSVSSPQTPTQFVKLWEAAQEFYAADSAWKESTRTAARDRLGKVLKETEPTDAMLVEAERASTPSSAEPPPRIDWLTFAAMLCRNFEHVQRLLTIAPGELAKYLEDTYKQTLDPLPSSAEPARHNVFPPCQHDLSGERKDECVKCYPPAKEDKDGI